MEKSSHCISLYLSKIKPHASEECGVLGCGILTADPVSVYQASAGWVDARIADLAISLRILLVCGLLVLRLGLIILDLRRISLALLIVLPDGLALLRTAGEDRVAVAQPDAGLLLLLLLVLLLVLLLWHLLLLRHLEDESHRLMVLVVMLREGCRQESEKQESESGQCLHENSLKRVMNWA